VKHQLEDVRQAGYLKRFARKAWLSLGKGRTGRVVMQMCREYAPQTFRLRSKKSRVRLDARLYSWMTNTSAMPASWAGGFIPWWSVLENRIKVSCGYRPLKRTSTCCGTKVGSEDRMVKGSQSNKGRSGMKSPQ